MTTSEPQNNRPKNDNSYNMTLAAVVGQVGCITPVILIGALFAGLWLDRQFETKPLFTILFIVGSAPVSVYVLYRIVKSATGRLKTTSSNSAKTSEEEANRE
jgi:F0F1-type ATP synthase assembly protein I